ncbi:hypothetical protein E4U51_005710 [Claviceps purpurea]|nr:hypothetical protein E4U51_005710 [Claviceps purpurea]
MRQQATIRSSSFIKKDNAARLTVQEFCDAINSDGREVKALINRIVSFSSSITGTRIFWTAERRQLDSRGPTVGLSRSSPPYLLCCRSPLGRSAEAHVT